MLLEDIHTVVTIQRVAPDNPPKPESKAEEKRKLPLKKRIQIFAVRTFGLALMHLIGKTTFCRKVGEHKVDEARGPERKPVILTLFHGPLFPIVYWGIPGTCVMTSASADGEILAYIAKRLGYTTVRGSSGRGGKRAMIQLARQLRDGVDIAIAVDGPKGPANQVKPGAVLLAKLSGSAIVPVATTTKTYWRFQSWDRFRLPLPINRALIYAADPITVPADADDGMVEAKRAELERVMLDLQEKVDHDMRSIVLRLPDRKPRDKMYHQKDAEPTGRDT